MFQSCNTWHFLYITPQRNITEPVICSVGRTLFGVFDGRDFPRIHDDVRNKWQPPLFTSLTGTSGNQKCSRGAGNYRRTKRCLSASRFPVSTDFRNLIKQIIVTPIGSEEWAKKCSGILEKSSSVEIIFPEDVY